MLENLRDSNPDDLALRDAEHYLFVNAEVYNARHNRLWQAVVWEYWSLMTIGYSSAKVVGVIQSTPPTPSELSWGIKGCWNGLLY